MVLKGQFLERPALIPSGGVVLEGLAHRGRQSPPLLIVPPPPAEGGSMDHVVAAELAWAAAMAGHPTLRFNFRGAGASQGRPAGPEERLQDAEGARQLLAENAGTPELVLACIGGSAALGLELVRRDPAIRALALVSPTGIEPASLAPFSLPLVVVVAEHDQRLPRAALAEAVNQAGGHLAVIEKADPAFTRNLTQVGKAVAHLLRRLAPSPT